MFIKNNVPHTPVVNPNLSMVRTPVETLDFEKRLTTYDEIESTYTEEEAVEEARRCLSCQTHWCTQKCPAGMPIPEFITAVKQRDFEKAYKIICSSSTLPEFCSRVCPQQKQCQSNCTRSLRGEAVAIGRLERFVVEKHFKNAEETEIPMGNGKKVAVVGSGPSGLSAAIKLNEMGHDVTVYDKAANAGGLLRYGIPSMKLKNDIVDRRIARMEKSGIEFVLNTEIGMDVTFDNLKASYDAVVICIGAGIPRNPLGNKIDGVKNVAFALDYLAADSNISAEKKDVVILGGGDTGNDCVSYAVRQKCRSVKQLEMLPEKPVAPMFVSPLPVEHVDHKMNYGLEEALTVFGELPTMYQTTVKNLITDETGNLKEIETVMLEPKLQQGSRKFTMEEIPGTTVKISCQLLVIAAGFSGADASNLEISEKKGKVGIQDRRFATSDKKVFTCGDCHSGQSTVVKAMLEGMSCAEEVDTYLKL